MRFQFLLFACCLVGCSPDALNRAAVEGLVTIDGTPLEKGCVNWYPLESQGPTVGADVVDGKYRLEKKNGPVVGPYRLEIQGWPVKTGRKIPAQQNPSVLEDELIDPVPAKYHSKGMGVPAKDELKATVRSGKNVIDFALTSD